MTTKKESSQIKLLKNKIKKLEKLVFIDDLTGVYNRRGFINVAEKFFQEHRQYLKCKNKKIVERKNEIKNIAIIFIDIDNFKSINDSHGHLKGDRILKKLAFSFSQAIRDTDIIGRWGGDEFVIMLINVLPKKAKEICQRIVKASLLAKKTKQGVHHHRKVKADLSFGVVFAKNEKTLLELIKKADKLMYQEKKTKKYA